jgi:SAM-dependent methyltransferase
MSRVLARRITHDVELMDEGPCTSAEIAGSLGDLRRYNLRLGGWRLMRRAVAPLLAEAGRARQATLLDIATGSGDMPAAFTRWAARRGVELRAVGMDVKDDMLAEARRYLDGTSPGVRLVQADALRLPHADGSIDIVICSTFLHHLDNAQARQALAEMKRVARVGVVVIDLVRSRIAWGLVWALTRLTSRNRLTLYDGPLSVRRSFTVPELVDLARAAGLAGAKVRRAGPVRALLTWRAVNGGVRS